MAALTEFKTDRCHYFEDENGLRHGEYKSWYDNGQPLEHSNYVNDMRHGEYMRWYGNGQLACHCQYADDGLHGEYMHWYGNGDLWVHGHYINGLIHGEYKSWYEDGALHAHCVYIANKKLDVDITNITHKDKFLLNLKYGDLHWLP